MMQKMNNMMQVARRLKLSQNQQLEAIDKHRDPQKLRNEKWNNPKLILLEPKNERRRGDFWWQTARWEKVELAFALPASLKSQLHLATTFTYLELIPASQKKWLMQV